MRKSAKFDARICERCGQTYIPVSGSQKYCATCGKIRDIERKHDFYVRTNPDAKPKVKCEDVCCICGVPFSSHFEGKPYCNKHYLRMKLHGTPDYVGRKPTTKYEFRGETVLCTVKSGRTFVIDADDLELIRPYSWCFSKTGYVVARIDGRVVKLHILLLGTKPDQVIDHKNGDPADNRRCNLRFCTQKENSMNTCSKGKSGLPLGVSYTPTGKYRARLMLNRKEIRLGTFDNIEDAIAARQQGELKYFGAYSPSVSRQTSTLGLSE